VYFNWLNNINDWCISRQLTYICIHSYLDIEMYLKIDIWTHTVLQFRVNPYGARYGMHTTYICVYMRMHLCKYTCIPSHTHTHTNAHTHTHTYTHINLSMCSYRCTSTGSTTSTTGASLGSSGGATASPSGEWKCKTTSLVTRLVNPFGLISTNRVGLTLTLTQLDK